MNIHNSKTYLKDLDTAIAHTVGIESLSRRSILITGATGTIGSFLTDMLVRYAEIYSTGSSIYAAGRNMERLQDQYGLCAGVTILPYDANKPIDFDKQIDYIIHAAGNAYPAAFNGNPVETIMGNLTGTYNLLEYGRTHGSRRVLYVSSGEVYGQGDLLLEEFDESYAGFIDIVSPRSGYPSSKRAAENLCACYSSQFGLETVISRPCHTYVPQITPNDNRASVQFMRNALKGEDIVMKSPGSQLRSYNYVADCASAILTVLINGRSGEAYNIANPQIRLTIAEVANVIAKTAGKKVIFANADATDIANRTPISRQVLSSNKLEGLGWRGAYTIEQGIKHTMEILWGN